ncbi:hypothetical protein DUZ99_12730 [Xylanibacillus composti]|uniref:Uncharacterized protein n=1 Tax=Xylanibacillus composti TaxID=1572762 RepID=A0A8J4H1K4_9BACL|nr:hypothetical protein [Xylanibacillus composti]MDT9725837.1 hypothetical protein [Xylanibacillus composti]GIQ69209.1 hypothetical protein XYCOK13_20330 [Xylanibacillus composti]
MSKLDGNGRWESKMALTEHVEQYEKRNQPKNLNRPTTEELAMIRDFILLPLMLTMVQKAADDIKNSPNILRRHFLFSTQILMNRIEKDMYLLRKELTRRNIKVMTEEQVDVVVYHKIICRGYEERFGMVRDVVRSEISVRLTKYLNEMSKLLESYGK